MHYLRGGPFKNLFGTVLFRGFFFFLFVFFCFVLLKVHGHNLKPCSSCTSPKGQARAGHIFVTLYVPFFKVTPLTTFYNVFSSAPRKLTRNLTPLTSERVFSKTFFPALSQESGRSQRTNINPAPLLHIYITLTAEISKIARGQMT